MNAGKCRYDAASLRLSAVRILISLAERICPLRFVKASAHAIGFLHTESGILILTTPSHLRVQILQALLVWESIVEAVRYYRC
jgi:hypothetical protein